LIFAFYVKSLSQIETPSFGVSANFSFLTNLYANSSTVGFTLPKAEVHLLLTPHIDITMGLGITNISKTIDPEPPNYVKPDDQTIVLFNLTGKFLAMANKDVIPYFGLSFDYGTYPKYDGEYYDETSSSFGITLLFVGQAFISKHFAVFGHLGLGYGSYSITKNIKVEVP